MNPNNLRVIDREIASAIVISSDDKVLMGRKDPSKGGVYADAWHIPGGGVDEGELLEDALRRELSEEVIGLDLTNARIKRLDLPGGGETEKILATGERVWVRMNFNRFEVRMPQTADKLLHEIKAGDELVELRFFTRDELNDVEQIPGGREAFRELGYMY